MGNHNRNPEKHSKQNQKISDPLPYRERFSIDAVNYFPICSDLTNIVQDSRDDRCASKSPNTFGRSFSYPSSPEFVTRQNPPKRNKQSEVSQYIVYPFPNFFIFHPIILSQLANQHAFTLYYTFNHDTTHFASVSCAVL